MTPDSDSRVRSHSLVERPRNIPTRTLGCALERRLRVQTASHSHFIETTNDFSLLSICE